RSSDLRACPGRVVLVPASTPAAANRIDPVARAAPVRGAAPRYPTTRPHGEACGVAICVLAWRISPTSCAGSSGEASRPGSDGPTAVVLATAVRRGSGTPSQSPWHHQRRLLTDENRPDSPPVRKRAAAHLWRHRARRPLPDRGARPAGPRRDALRQRGFAHQRPPAPHGAGGASPVEGAPRSPSLAPAAARRDRARRRRVRHRAFPYRPAALPPV